MVLQTTMATIAAETVVRSMISGATIPVPMVKATAVPEKAPAALRAAAMKRACCGFRTRVETTVAMALGESVQPLTNSAMRIKTSAAARPMLIAEGRAS